MSLLFPQNNASPSICDSVSPSYKHIMSFGMNMKNFKNIPLNLQFTITTKSIASSHVVSHMIFCLFAFFNLYLCRKQALLYIHAVTHNLHRELPSNNHLSCCWSTGTVEGLSALLKDMSNESEVWVSVAFLPPWSFIILILPSYLFICKHHLHTPCTHPHCLIAVVPPPALLFPSITVSPLSPLMLHPPVFSPPTATFVSGVKSNERVS